MEATCDGEHITSNFVQSFNVWMEKFRFMPLVKMLEKLRVKLMESIWVRKVITERWSHPLTPKVCYRIKKL